jgi:hypothetical protein
MHFSPWYSALPWAQSNRANQTWTENSETVSQSQNKPFFPLSWFSQIFCHCNRKLAHSRTDNSSSGDPVRSWQSWRAFVPVSSPVSYTILPHFSLGLNKRWECLRREYSLPFVTCQLLAFHHKTQGYKEQPLKDGPEQVGAQVFLNSYTSQHDL